jgi:hypothetical protein
MCAPFATSGVGTDQDRERDADQEHHDRNAEELHSEMPPCIPVDARRLTSAALMRSEGRVNPALE